MKTPLFTAPQVLQHQQANGFHSHILTPSTTLLARYRQEYAVKRALYDTLFNTLNESVARLTVQTNTAEVSLLVPHELLEAALQPLIDKLEKELSQQEKWVLEQAAHVERGINECGLDGSPEQWAAVELLTGLTSQAA
ncbi:hypothetical protein [Hymenobacter metallilatus]|uniref:Uncharacterized protein n=1 Tax=Hymenobacter metallilatus TaxID=2493666 RepID=A0A3R9LXA5_9BACT|nr:hypothetical protein [Hymenobacter metallilatus]RSK23950.1 hypothetical protein EI290_21420 [Hymenobacter metallilatus]